VTKFDSWKRVLLMQESLLSSQIQREVNVRRYRLGAPPLSTIRTQVEQEVLSKSNVRFLLSP
jgi:hypothetical protein